MRTANILILIWLFGTAAIGFQADHDRIIQLESWKAEHSVVATERIAELIALKLTVFTLSAQISELKGTVDSMVWLLRIALGAIVIEKVSQLILARKRKVS